MRLSFPRLLAVYPLTGDPEACACIPLWDTQVFFFIFYFFLFHWVVSIHVRGEFKHLYAASWHMQYFLTVPCQFLFFFWKILYYKLTLVLTHAIKK